MTSSPQTEAGAVRPVRLQLSRRKGFDLQAHSRAVNGLPAVNCARPSIFGNPILCQSPYACPHHPDFEREAWEEDDGSIDPFRCCVDAYRHYVETGVRGELARTGRLKIALEAAAGYPRRTALVAALPRLRGSNLACWCRLCPAHATAGKPLDTDCPDCAPCHVNVLGRIVCDTPTPSTDAPRGDQPHGGGL